jgi:hypothetical protein
MATKSNRNATPKKIRAEAPESTEPLQCLEEQFSYVSAAWLSYLLAVGIVPTPSSLRGAPCPVFKKRRE